MKKTKSKLKKFGSPRRRKLRNTLRGVLIKHEPGSGLIVDEHAQIMLPDGSGRAQEPSKRRSVRKDYKKGIGSKRNGK